METWVYQLCSDTELLYVGKSYSLHKRLLGHRRTQPWWPEVTEIRKEQFATEDEARQREKEIWASGRPKYNKVSPLRTREEELQEDRERKKLRRQQPGVRERERKNERERFRTDPEYRERRREVLREAYRKQRERFRIDPEYREHRRKISRESWRRTKGKRWQQEGPGLF